MNGLSSTVDANSATFTPILCSFCHLNLPKYTCPRCSFKSCSLQCSTSHKARFNCSGVRDQVAYVPMNQYGWGTMMGDYTYLEGVGRKVGELGGEIVKAGFLGRGRSGRGRGRANGRGRGRGRGNGGIPSVPPDAFQSPYGPNVGPNGLPLGWTVGGRAAGTAPEKPNLQTLQRQMALRDIKVKYLPDGMEKRRLNQSVWDNRTKSPMLTMEFIFYLDDSAPSNSSPYTLLTHRNAINLPLQTIIKQQLENRKALAELPDAPPAWILRAFASNPVVQNKPGKSLKKDVGDDSASDQMMETDEDEHDSGSPEYLFLLAEHPPKPPRKLFHALDPSRPLSTLLRNRSFIEWPTIEIRQKDLFDGEIVGQDSVPPVHPPTKKRKLDSESGKALISGLVGGYDSQESDDEMSGEKVAANDEASKAQAGINIGMLNDYESDSGMDSPAREPIEDSDQDAEGESYDEEEEEALLAAEDQAQREAAWRLFAEAAVKDGIAEDDDALSWGDSVDDEVKLEKS